MRLSLTKRIATILLSFSTVALLSLPAYAVEPSSGLSIEDAGKASCEGTLGGGSLSDAQLKDICDKYRQSNTEPVAEVVKALLFLGLGTGLGYYLNSRSRARKTK